MCAMSVGMALDGPLELIPREEWADEIIAAAADELKYDGEALATNLIVELPFWLMTPDASVSLAFEQARVTAHIRSDFVEVGCLSRFLDSRINLRYIGPAEAATTEPSIRSLRGIVLRPQKTVLVFDAFALKEAFDAWQLSSGERASTAREERARQRRINNANHYFQTLAIAHLPFLNQLITSYRAASQDPFAFEVSTWDVPLWWAQHDDVLVRINLMPYKDSDDYPAVRSASSGERSSYFAVDTDSLSNQLSRSASPSYVELLDAQSLLRRGRYNEAVRATVTAIEVEFETQLRALYKRRGDKDCDIDMRLNDSKLNFMDRVEEWEQLVQRRLPGPRTSPYPHLNGLRLKEELLRTRALRHKIVHEGYRITTFSKGLANRAVDAMRWLHEWLTGRDHYSEQHTRNGELFNAIFGLTFEFGLMGIQYTSDRVKVQRRFADLDKLPIAHEVLAAQFASLIEPKTSDVELFAVMAFQYLKLAWADGPPDPPRIVDARERFRITVDGKRVAVFLLESDGIPKDNALDAVVSRMAALRTEGGDEMAGMCLIHHQRLLPSHSREIDGAVSGELKCKAVANRLSLVTTTDLWCLIHAATEYGWELPGIGTQFAIPGRQGIPPAYRSIGHVTRLFERRSALEIQLDPGQTLRFGEKICTRIRDRYHELEVGSLHFNREPVEIATGPALVGIATDLNKKAIRKGAIVFKRHD